MRMSDRKKDCKMSWFSKGAFLRKNSAAKTAAVLRENANIRDVHDSAWGDPAGVNRLTDEWVCEEWRSCCAPELKRKTGLGEAARQSETASSPTEVTSWGDGSRADGSTQKKGERKREGEEVPKMKEAFFFSWENRQNKHWSNVSDCVLEFSGGVPPQTCSLVGDCADMRVCMRATHNLWMRVTMVLKAAWTSAAEQVDTMGWACSWSNSATYCTETHESHTMN